MPGLCTRQLLTVSIIVPWPCSQVKTFQSQSEAASQSALQHAATEEREVASLLASHAVEKAMLRAAWQVDLAAASKAAEQRAEAQAVTLREVEGRCVGHRAACMELAQSLKAVQARWEGRVAVAGCRWE